MRRETEEMIFRETEVTTSEEKELQSTDRLEMSRETSKVIKQDSELSAKVSVSAKYGPVVEVSSSVEGSIKKSREEATREAASFSKDVTQRSATAVTERVLERYSLRVTNEVIEKNNHALDNVGGAKHISGVYQWANKSTRRKCTITGCAPCSTSWCQSQGCSLLKPFRTLLRVSSRSSSHHHSRSVRTKSMNGTISTTYDCTEQRISTLIQVLS